MKKLYGIGLGPGDSEYITLKGYRLIRNADIVFIPNSGKKNIAGEIAGDFIRDKKVMEIEFPMGKCGMERYIEAAKIIDDNLKDGAVGVYLTLGDPMVYSTFLYLMTELEKIGINVESVPGVSSINAAANRIRMPLTLKGESFYITDGSIDENILKSADTICILKTAGDKHKIMDILESHGFMYAYIRRCGCRDEKILYKRDEILKDDEYMSLILGRREKQD